MALDIGGTLTGKVGPFPLWVWGLGFVGVMVFIIKRRNAAAAATPSTAAAAGQTSTDLGSATELANMFEVAGLMPYQGGATYVNTTQDSSNSTAAAPVPDQYNKAGRDLGPYLSGLTQIQFITNNVGKYGYSKKILTAVQNAYANTVKSKGAAAANSYHYTYHGNGTVTADPVPTASSGATSPIKVPTT